ncbi:MAG: TetR/AcrR family transcriptional regulator [Dehalococcoidia bacterium]
MQPTNNRAQILRAALDLFASRGYDASGVKEIVEAVGITKPTLYHYFGSKQGLLDALLTEHSCDFLRDLEAAARYEGNLPVTLDRVVAMYLAFAAAQPAFCRFLLSLLFAPPASDAHGPAARVTEAQRQLLEAMFQAASRDHGNMRGWHTQYAWSLLGVLAAYMLLVVNQQLEPTARLRRDIVRKFSHGIYS